MNLLVTGAFAWKKEELEALEQLGHQVMFMQQEKSELPCDPVWVEGAICNGLFLSHPIEQFTSLRYIQLTSAGFDRVPMAYIKEHNIEIKNARGIYSIPMAEFVVSGVLQLYKQSRFFYENQKRHRWEKHCGLLEFSGKTVVIVGCGSVGTECAKRFNAFGCTVIGVDVIPCHSKWYAQIVNLDDLDKLIPACDVVVLTLPLTDETRGLFNKVRISNMKDAAVLVNIARGEIVDQTALIEELNSKRISAVLDVFDAEPLAAQSPLWEMENVLVTPHNSFVGDGNHQRMINRIVANLREA